MPAELSYLSAFLVGLLGGVHCAGMCGAIVGALSFGLPPGVQGRVRPMLPYLLAYNTGRIASYTLAGAVMGGVGWLASNAMVVNQGQQVLQAAAGLFMIALGLYLGGWWFGLSRVEQAGGVIWRRVEPLGRRLLPVRGPAQALWLGAVWGWLPCGLVYSVLIWAIATGSPGQGAMLLLAFGLGTLPNLLAMGVFAAALSSWVQRLWIRRLAGALIVAFGLLMLFRLWPGSAG